jgi:ParB-like chromosome segregation protein Spo0J
MQIEKRKVSELKYYPGNPRKISAEMLEKLKNSLKEFGVVDPLVINKNNEVIGGNQRLKAIKELGITEVDCVVVDLPKSKEKALNVALNKIQGEFDEELLKLFIEDIEPIDLELTGLDLGELRHLTVDLEKDGQSEDNTDYTFNTEGLSAFFVFGNIKEEIPLEIYEKFKQFIRNKSIVDFLLEVMNDSV